MGSDGTATALVCFNLCKANAMELFSGWIFIALTSCITQFVTDESHCLLPHL